MPSSFAGKLLVAGPELFDPNFARSVILMIEHSAEEGAFGLILNRPLALDPRDDLPAWAPLFDPPLVFLGGPVQPEMAVGLVDTPGAPPDGWAPVVGNIGPADLSGGPETMGGVLRARVWAGYSGWDAGQLESELHTRSWFVVDADPADPFTDRPGDLWRDVLRRQGRPLAWYADFPLDPSVN